MSENRKRLDKFDNEHIWQASQRKDETTEDEQRAIGYCLGMYAANEPVEYDDYKIAMGAVYRLGITTPPLGWGL